jgi:transcription-repair coupling factor (superfamily II helicase)
LLKTKKDKVLNLIKGWKHPDKIKNLINSGKDVSIKNVSGSLHSLSLLPILNELDGPVLILAPDNNGAEQWYHDLKIFLERKELAYLVPPVKSMKSVNDPSEEHIGWLVEGLNNMLNKGTTAIASPDIFKFKVPAPNDVYSDIIEIKTNDTIDYDDFIKNLLTNGFDKKDYVAVQGDIAVRGGIVDIFPIGWDNPLRIEFWGNDIESVREFDVLSQRSVSEHEKVEFIGGIYDTAHNEATQSIINYFDDKLIIVIEQPEILKNQIDDYELLDKYRKIEYNPFNEADIKLKSIPQSKFESSVKNLSKELVKHYKKERNIIISADGEIHLNRIKEIVSNYFDSDDAEDDLQIKRDVRDDLLDHIIWFDETFASGFTYDAGNIVCYTEHQIFDRLRTRDFRRKAMSHNAALQEMRNLKPGDYVVHEDKGVGKFMGFETVNLGGSLQDCVRLAFAEGDTLFVHLNYINKVQKYSAQEGNIPVLSKLGGTEWLRKKARTKKKLKDIARDLIKLYAERKMQKGYAFPSDTNWQKEFEASFLYEDTPDQATTTEELKADMENDIPMDRLVCGDVGFGKTEIAIRAAFKAVQAGKQVALLVPTTILAQQHYMTFKDRINKYPVNTEVISRFRSRKEQAAILEGLEKGKVDILIGTHRLLSKDIKFKDLGLLIIDEEHRFGVSAKEKLRQLKVQVDTLTLTATPIPRTLNFSLMGARDLSVIETPPRNRIPVHTEIIEWDDDTIIDAIDKEIKRGGQVFFVNDKVMDIRKLAIDMNMLMPSLRIGVAHGQMKPSEIEKTMEKFISGKYDMLVATKIIESGIDIPNANTMIINHSQNFGLAELYQLRGRVGRANKQAFCYLVIPNNHKLPKKAIQRLQAIEEFTDLGSGFKLAMRDMEIRGAGNLLGAEQSGFILDIGFEMFQKILDEAVSELRTEEFSDLFPDEGDVHSKIFKNDDIAVDTEFDAFFPNDYITGDTDRFNYYKALYRTETNSDLEKLISEISDKFGKMPREANNLMFVVKLRIAALNTGFARVSLKNNTLTAEFPAETNAEYYEHAFPLITELIQDFEQAQLTQYKNKLMLKTKLKSRDEAVEILWKIKKTLEFVEFE